MVVVCFIHHSYRLLRGSSLGRRTRNSVRYESCLGNKRKSALFTGLEEIANRTLLLVLWAVLICCVVIGSLAPAASPLMVVIGRLQI